MGERELQDALRARAQERIRRLWQDAEQAVAARRAAVAAEEQALRQAVEWQLATTAVAVRREVLATAALTAQQACLGAEHALCERLHALAGRCLSTLAPGFRHRLWQALAAELPAGDWRRLRVHPDDLAAARAAFPAAEVNADPVLAGGLVAESADGRLVVDNSLAGRLERGWPELLAPLFAAINAEVDKDAAGIAAID